MHKTVISAVSARRAYAIIALTCLVSGAVLAWHFSMTFLYVAPRNPIYDRLDKVVNAYMVPYFTQNWQLFGPDPLEEDRSVLVRAKVIDTSNQEQVTPWLDVTSAEFAEVKGHLFPGRISRFSIGVYDFMNGSTAPDDKKRAEAFARTVATLAARAQWGYKVTQVQMRFVDRTFPRPSEGEHSSVGKVETRDFPWWSAEATTPSAVKEWKAAHQ
jgi:Family of unknown function (DUF5819)